MKCSNEDNGSTTITTGSTCYIVTGLDEDSSYTFTVTASNIAGNARSGIAMGMTEEAGEGLCKWCGRRIDMYSYNSFSYSPLCISWFCVNI